MSPRLLLAVLPLLLAGCVSAPRFEAADPVAPAAWSAATPSESASLVTSGSRASAAPWWTALDDPLLDQLMAEAERENFDLLRARARVLEARGRAAAAGARLYPEVGIAAGAGRGNAAIPGVDRAQSLYDAAFDARWEADLFGANRGRADAAQALGQASEEGAADVLLTLRAELGRSYVELRGAQNRLALALDTLHVRRETADLVRSLRSAGLRSELDVAQAESQVLAVESQIPPLRAAVEIAAWRVDILLGQPPGTLQSRLAAPAPVPVAERPAVLDAPASVIARRPDVRRAGHELAAAARLTDAAVADTYPKVSLAGLFGLRDVSGAAGYTLWSLGAGIAAPLINFGRLQAEVDVADARRRQAYYGYRQTVLEALREVESALAGYIAADSNRRALDALVETEQRRLALAQERYTRGLSPFLEVLDAQRALYAARTELVIAEAEVTKGYVALNKALGG
ncbi:MAG TPA: efflux transporter outer membrane subunit [Burkholderiales bacterium]|nr:efflux transporter outer membrane subunit [Burkholderiales bacterium]